MIYFLKLYLKVKRFLAAVFWIVVVIYKLQTLVEKLGFIKKHFDTLLANLDTILMDVKGMH